LLCPGPGKIGLTGNVPFPGIDGSGVVDALDEVDRGFL